MTTADNFCSAQITHNLRNTITCSYSNNTYATTFNRSLNKLFVIREDTVFVLVNHIFNLDIVQGAPLLSSVQYVTRIFAVNMYFNNVFYNSNNQGVTKALDSTYNGLFIYICTFYDKFGAIGEFQIQRFFIVSLHFNVSLLGNFDFCAVFATQASQATFEESNQTLTTCVNYASSFKSRKFFRSFCQFQFANTNSFIKDVFQAFAVTSCGISTLCNTTSYCQNSTFYRLRNTTIGKENAILESFT